MKLKINRQNLYLAGGSAAVVVFLLIIAAIYFPFKGELDKIRSQKTAYDQETLFFKNLTQTKGNTKVSSQLGSQDKLPEVMAAFNKLAEKNGIILTPLTPPVVSKNDPGMYREVVFDLEAIGSFSNLGQFLSGVRDMPEGIVDVKHLNIESQKGVPDKVIAKAGFALLISRKND